MRQDNKTKRQQQIEQAAYDVLDEKGFAGASMLAIARRAKASNETLYNWYGDKGGLFKALVVRNAQDVKTILSQSLEIGDDPIELLGKMGPVLLHVLTGERAVALNRAAAADATGELGGAIAQAGRNTIAPLIAQVLLRARDRGDLGFDRADQAADLYISLLIGDWQIRRVIGQMPPPSESTIAERAGLAVQRLCTLLPPAD